MSTDAREARRAEMNLGKDATNARDMMAQNSQSPQTPFQKILLDPSKMLMVIFLLSELSFFGALITTYLYYQAGGIKGPNAKEALNFGQTAIFTAFLLGSSGTIFLADRALVKRNRRALVFWLVVTAVMGLIFIVGQGIEYSTLINDNITMSRNLFGTTFFTLTGFHGMHVIAGLLALSIMALLAALGDFDSGHSSALTAVSWYWHFVDVVWVILFTMIYVIPTFFG